MLFDLARSDPRSDRLQPGVQGPSLSQPVHGDSNASATTIER